jgi:selenide,water dikinase
VADPNLLVGLDTSDDAGVYQINDDTALIQTLDFFTPVVDDPYSFGMIAAANALSDVYAMGGKPLTAMNIIGFPSDFMDLSILADILRGGADKIREAGAVLVGGHSVQDNEPKYGLSVTGIVHPDRVLTNAGAQAGDVLVLTKPLGVGIITTAIKGELASDEEVAQVTEVMAALNKSAAEVMIEVGVNGCTDITGFGLLGHASEMAKASDVSMTLFSAYVPVLEAAHKYVAMGIVPEGTRGNLKYFNKFVDFNPEVKEETRLILADAITSGGLFISVPAAKSGKLVDGLHAAGVTAAVVIGEVTRAGGGRILVE